MSGRADTPTPRICRKFTREGGAVSSECGQGTDHPLPRQACAENPVVWSTFAKQRGKDPVARSTLAEQSGKVCPQQLSQGKVEKDPVSQWTFAKQSRKVCRPRTFAKQSGEVCPAGLPGGRLARRAGAGRPGPGGRGPGGPSRVIRKAEARFRKVWWIRLGLARTFVGFRATLSGPPE